MNNISNTELTFYQKLGALFYAIAASDKVVRKSEFETLYQIVEEDWKGMDDFEDEFQTDAAYQIDIVFDWLKEEAPEAQACFKEFESYYKEHPNRFNEARKALIMRTAKRIAGAFGGTNKSELMMMGRLRLLFNI